MPRSVELQSGIQLSDWTELVRNSYLIYFLKFYLFLAVLGLCCCEGFSLIVVSRVKSLVVV